MVEESDIFTGESVVNMETINLPMIENKDLYRVIVEYCTQNGINLISVDSVTIIPKCIGCQGDQPGQLAHMEPGGCLYIPSQSENSQDENSN